MPAKEPISKKPEPGIHNKIRQLRLPDHEEVKKNVSLVGSRLSRASGHFVVHFFQGAELGSRVGATIGALAGGFVGLAGGFFANATVKFGAKIGMVAFSAIGSAVGALISTPFSFDDVYAELKGNPRPITGIKKLAMSNSSAFLKDAMGLFLEKDQEAPSQTEPKQKAAAAFEKVAKKAVHGTKTNTADAQMEMAHITDEERFTLVEQMLPEFVMALEIKARTGKDFPYLGIRQTLESLDTQITQKVEELFVESPTQVIQASRSFKGLQKLLYTPTARIETEQPVAQNRQTALMVVAPTPSA